MTAKEEAYQLLDQLSENVTWDDLLTSLRRAAGRHLKLPVGRPQDAEATTHRATVARDPATRERELEHFLECEIWAQIPPAVLGQTLTKEAREEILGYGPTATGARHLSSGSA